MPISAQVQFAFINGHRYSRTSLALFWNGKQIPGLTAINFKTSVAPGISYGSRALPQGRTRGKVTLTADIEMYEEDYQGLLGGLIGLGKSANQGPFEVASTVTLTRFETALGTTKVTLQGVRINDAESSNGDNEDQAKRKLTLSVMNILEHGVPMVVENTALGF